MPTTIQKLNPINKSEEKEKFFFDHRYNPQFVYPKGLSTDERSKYGEVSAEYLNVARAILDAVLGKWKTETAFLDEIEGPVLTKEEFAASTKEYLKQYGWEQEIKLNFSPNFVSQTSMVGRTMNVRIPITHRKKRLVGTLNHELGTHFLRRLNEEQQPWAEKRDAFDFHPHFETEEGLAILHSHLNLDSRLLWFAALRYYSVYQASKLSFADLFADLRQYVDDKERRWKMCVRAKRGVTDTSQPVAVAKDQVYLRGTVKVLAWLRAHKYDARALYWGKLAFEDIERAQVINPNYEPKLPLFLQDLKEYAKEIKAIEKENGLSELE